MKKLGVKGMTEDRFWELVALAKWPCDYDKMKIKYLKLLSAKECKDFRKVLNQANDKLDTVIGSAVDDMPVGDDSYSDLIHHIVGLGKARFYQHCHNIQLIAKRAEAINYEESFAYCIPYEEDYGPNNEYTLKHVKKMAREVQKEIDLFRKMDSNGHGYLRPLHKEMDDIEMLAQNFLDNPTEDGLNGLVSAREWMPKAVKKIDKFFNKNCRELPRKFTEERKDGSRFNGMCTALFANFIGDAETVKEFLTSTE